VELFGQPFEAPLAAAELARASGCALIGVTIVRRRDGYAVKVLPEFAYDRRALAIAKSAGIDPTNPACIRAADSTGY